MNQSPRPPARLADGLATGDPNVPRMSNRYSLRFETGERRGEQIPLTGSKFTIGRRPGNSLQVLETSVSGKHAELLVSDEQILLRDLGSTNGTRVGGEKVLESRLKHGAEVYGNSNIDDQTMKAVLLRSMDGDTEPQIGLHHDKGLAVL